MDLSTGARGPVVITVEHLQEKRPRIGLIEKNVSRLGVRKEKVRMNNKVLEYIRREAEAGDEIFYVLQKALTNHPELTEEVLVEGFKALQESRKVLLKQVEDCLTYHSPIRIPNCS